MRSIIASVVLMCAFVSPSPAEEIKASHGGLTLNALVERAENWPSGPVILMTHGTLAHNGMEIITTLQGLFGEAGVSTLAINLSLGLDDRHGMYDCATAHTHKHGDALDEIGVWLDWLETQGIEQVFLLGHSRGGNQTAWFAAERHEPSVQGLILIAPSTWSQEQEASSYRARYNEELESLLSEANKHLKNGTPQTQLGPVGFIYCAEATATAQSVVSYYAPDPRRDTPNLLSRINKPILIVAGSMDTVVEGLESRVAPLADGATTQLIVIEGADHFFRDLYADELVESALEFMGVQ